jgi:DNA-binding XRE family transcriptional regulator
MQMFAVTLTKKAEKGAKKMPFPERLKFDALVSDLARLKNKAIPYQETSFYKELKQEATPAMTLKVMREYKNMTLSDLAKKSGISAQNLSAMEAGRRAIGKKSAVKIAAAIGCGAPECYC